MNFGTEYLFLAQKIFRHGLRGLHGFFIDYRLYIYTLSIYLYIIYIFIPEYRMALALRVIRVIRA
jgi:hypothetical protein